MRSYGPLMSIRKLFGVLIALAMLFAPSAVAAEQMATMPGHDMQMMEMGHCDAPPSKTADHDKNAGKSCCISMCMAVAVTHDAPVTDVAVEHAATYFAVPQFWHGYLGEIATPPPRTA